MNSRSGVEGCGIRGERYEERGDGKKEEEREKERERERERERGAVEMVKKMPEACSCQRLMT